MGWFNAGTDQREAAPDLFGCVELPAPACCFGPAENPQYGSQQRAALLAHLKDEKAQMLPWPSILKACFSTAQSRLLGSVVSQSAAAAAASAAESVSFSSAMSTGKGIAAAVSSGRDAPSQVRVLGLLGSPMLDTALGQVDAVSRAYAEIIGEATSASTGKGSRAAAALLGSPADNTQFDSNLPPELPTAWVQCESCRKWRRVAFHVDVDALPDEWTCAMNTWEPESASCKAPQDSYDPDKESTLEFAAPKEETETLTIGAWRDVFCNKNLIFYEVSCV